MISISWGGPESSWTTQALGALDQSFADAASLGITVCVACGDNGSGDGVGDGQAHVDFPASSPHALACGGTRLQAAGGSITAETVWNEATGGATGRRRQPGVRSPGLAAGSRCADLGERRRPRRPRRAGRRGRCGSRRPAIRCASTAASVTVGGTSAVAPLWAALVALLNQQRGTPLGQLNPELYAAPADQAFRDITVGSNAVSGHARLLGRPWLGRLYGPRQPRRTGPAGRDSVVGRELRPERGPRCGGPAEQQRAALARRCRARRRRRSWRACGSR